MSSHIKQLLGCFAGIISPPEAIFGAQDLDLGSGCAGDLFGPKMGPGKTRFCGGICPHGVLGGSVRGDWIVWYPGGLWARPFPPKAYQKIIFSTFPDFGTSSGAPLALHGEPLGPRVSPCPVESFKISTFCHVHA